MPRVGVRILTTALALGAVSARAQAPYLVKDLWPGPLPGNPGGPAAAGDRVFFSARTPELGLELWTSDGTEGSTTAVDVTPGAQGFGPAVMFTLNGEAFFRNLPSTAGLWKSDGTAAGTMLLSPLNGGQVARAASLPNRVLFGTDGPYPAVSDGTEAGTALVQAPLQAPPLPGYGFKSAAPFAGGFGVAMGSSAWWTDGISRATLLVPNNTPCFDAASAGGRLFLGCSGQLAVSDGTFAGTAYLPVGSFVASPLRSAGRLVFFMGGDSALWRTDGTPAGTMAVPFPGTAPTGLILATAVVSNGVLYFGGTTPGAGREVWRSDGTAPGTFMLRDIAPGTDAGVEDNGFAWITAAAGGVVFAATTGASGTEVWKSDGTQAGTVPLPEILPGAGSSFPQGFASAGGRVFFAAQDGVHGQELWAIDVAAGAVAVGDAAVEEGDDTGGTAVFDVRLESAAAVPVVVSYTTVPGTAQGGVDFTPQSGTLTFAPGERERTVAVPVLGDVADETNESFTLVLTPVGGAVMADGLGAGVIRDDDAPRVVANGTTVVEGDSGSSSATFGITVTTKNGGPTAAAGVLRFAGASGTATPAVDYEAFAGSLTFPAGTPSGTTLSATVTVFGDTVDEPDETFQLDLDGQNDLVVEGPTAGATILDDDGVAAAPPVELSHGASLRADLAPLQGPGPDRDFYVLLQRPEASYELVIDEASGDAAPLTVQRIAADGSTVLQSAVAAGTGTARSLRWVNTSFDPVTDQHVRVESASCGTVCGADDVYRVRLYDTTLGGARVNNTNGQVTALLLQNLTGDVVTAYYHIRTEDGTNGGWGGFTIPAHASYVHDLSQNLFVPGSVWVTHDAPYGGLVGKVVALDPVTGFSFDTPLAPRPR